MTFQELIDLSDSRVDPFILPFIQGYVELQQAPLSFETADGQYSEFSNPMLNVKPEDNLPDYYTMALISRRSRHRAGVALLQPFYDFTT